MYYIVQGQFTIVSLTGSHTYQEKSRDKIRLLSVHLANSDCRSCGGAVGNSLIAAGPTKVHTYIYTQIHFHLYFFYIYMIDWLIH